MHRIDTPTAQRDKFGEGKNGFTRGNPQTGTPATQLDYLYCDSIQEEIANVIELAGITLDKSKQDQLATAIKKFINDGSVKRTGDNMTGELSINGRRVLIEDELIFAPKLWFSNVPPDGYICLWGQKITQSSAPNLYRLYGEQLPDARDQYLRFSSGNRLPLTLEAGTSISEWVGSANNELWLGITNTDIGENFYEYRKYSSLSAGFGGVGSKFKKIRVQNIAFNLIVRYQ